MGQPQNRRSDERPKTSFYLPPDLKKRLKIAAAEQERDMRELVVEALEMYLAKIKRTRAD